MNLTGPDPHTQALRPWTSFLSSGFVPVTCLTPEVVCGWWLSGLQWAGPLMGPTPRKASAVSGRYSQVHVFIQLRGKVPWHLSTAVIVAVAFRDMIHIVEDEAVPVQVLHGLLEADIEEHGPVKGLGARLAGGEARCKALGTWPHKAAHMALCHPNPVALVMDSSTFPSSRQWDERTLGLYQDHKTAAVVGLLGRGSETRAL